MANYQYKAKSRGGKIVSGTIVAKDRLELMQHLKQQGLYCMEYKEIVKKESIKTPKIKSKDLYLLCRQFSTMLDAGIPVVKAMDILQKQSEKKYLKQPLLKISEEIQRGSSLSDAFKSQGEFFPQLFISMIESGEASGNLELVLTRMSEHYEKEYKLNNKIRTAMMYPMILSVVSIGVLFILMGYVVPTFFAMFEGMEDQLPWNTKLLIWASDLVRYNWQIIGIGLIFLGILFYFLKKTPEFKRIIDRIKIEIPVFGKLNRIVLSARFASTLSILFASGVALIESIEIIERVLNNNHLNSRFEEVKNDIKKGHPLSSAVHKMKIFPPMLTNMIVVGEESGSLESILDKTASFYSEEADAAVQKMVALLEPMMIVILGFMVGFIIAAVLPPMYSMYQNIL